jgi:hypothetical protein
MANFTMSATTLTFPDGTTMTTAAQSIPTGTVTNFFQASAPTAWTKLTTNDNAAIRIVSGTGGTTGGSVNFSTAFASQAVSGTNSAFTLTTNEIPSHSHVVTSANTAASSGSTVVSSSSSSLSSPTSNTGGSGSHNHTFTGTAINLAVKYLDNIMCSKN